MTEKRFILRNDGSIYRKKLRTLSLSEIVELLNTFEEREWEQFVNGGY